MRRNVRRSTSCTTSVVSAMPRAHRGSRPRAHWRSSGPCRRNSRLIARVSPALAFARSSADGTPDVMSFCTAILTEGPSQTSLHGNRRASGRVPQGVLHTKFSCGEGRPRGGSRTQGARRPPFVTELLLLRGGAGAGATALRTVGEDALAVRGRDIRHADVRGGCNLGAQPAHRHGVSRLQRVLAPAGPIQRVRRTAFHAVLHRLAAGFLPLD